ncbi:hypothetical protein Tco_1089464, partial [Tanacetum coccineum]
VMAIFVIFVSSDSSEERVGTSAGRVILFGTIPTTIPNATPTVTPPTTHVDTKLTPTEIPTVSPIVSLSPDYTPTSPDYSPTFDTESDPSEDLSSDRTLPLPATSPFLSSTDNSSNSDTPDTPPSPTHGIPFTEITPSTQSLPALSGALYSSSEASSDFHSVASPDSPLRYSSLAHSSPDSSSLSPAHANLLPPRVDLLPPPKRIKSSNSVTNLEVSSDESSELPIPRETDIDECIAYADSLRAKGIDSRVVVETVARKEVKTSINGMVEVREDRVTHLVVSDDIPEPAQEEGAIDVTYEMLGGLGHKIIAMSQQGDVMSERISELEWDNTRLKGMTIPNTRSGATMTREAVNSLISRRVAEALEARDAARNLESLAEGRDEQEDENGDDYKGGNRGGNENGNRNGGVNGNGGGNDNGNGNKNGNKNGGGNGYGNHNVNFGGFMPVARECTFQDFLKCQPLNFNGMEGVVGLTRWFDKMEMVFHISNCPQKCQVKYATCTLLNSALTWWNSHKRIIGVDAAYAMRWTELIKLMTERFQKLVLLYTRMVPDEEKKVERFIGDLPDNIQGNVIATEPTRLQDAIPIANNLMYQKLKGYARNAKKREVLTTTRETTVDNHLSSGKMLEVRTWQKLTRPKAMRKRVMLDPSPIETSASCTTKGRVL